MTGNVSGNAGTATKWATARDLSLTGDVTATLSNVDGSAAVSGAATLATTQTAVHTWSALQSITGGFLNGSASKSADYTLVAGDAGKIITFISNSGLDLTLPAGLSAGHITKIINVTGSTLAIAGDGTSSVFFVDSFSSPLANSRSCWVGNIGANIWYVFT